MRAIRIANWVVCLLGQKVSDMSKFWATKSAETNAHSACHDARPPSAPALERSEQPRSAAEITQCLHQTALAAASVCIPANHRRMFNACVALAPFNSLS